MFCIFYHGTAALFGGFYNKSLGELTPVSVSAAGLTYHFKPLPDKQKLQFCQYKMYNHSECVFMHFKRSSLEERGPIRNGLRNKDVLLDR